MLTHMSVKAVILFILVSIVMACEDVLPQISLPTAKHIEVASGTLQISDGLSFHSADVQLLPIKDVLAKEYALLYNKALFHDKKKESTILKVALDHQLKPEEYHLGIQDDIVIKGGSYQAVAQGSSTLMQLLEQHEALPKANIKDQPNFNFRSLMIDCSRNWHEIDQLKQMIQLCRLYKLNYLHLHLTDDQLFTFPSTDYPKLASENQSYSKEALIELNQYAYDRGVILLPEIDMPGHASSFVRAYPDIFGLRDVQKNSYTMNMGKESAYAAVENIIAEVASIFTYSPYIHIGGDEAHFAGLEEDPYVIEYKKKNELKDVESLFHHFLIKVHDMVKKNDKQTIVWAGFARDASIEIPKDIIVESWETQYYDPRLLAKDGYQFINASWKPLYVVNNRKWSPKYIYNEWTPYRWEAATMSEEGFSGIEIDSTELLIGASMCSWEQNQFVELERLRKRVAIFGHKLWSGEKTAFESIEKYTERTDLLLNKLIAPFDFTLEGINSRNYDESNFNEDFQFDDIATLVIKNRFDNVASYYSIDGTTYVKYTEPIKINKTCKIAMKSMNKNSDQIGLTQHTQFIHQPVTIVPTGLYNQVAPNAWTKMNFTDSISVTLSTDAKDGNLVYSLFNNEGKVTDIPYTEPIIIHQSSRIVGQLIDSSSNPIGRSSSQSYEKLQLMECLTTGKPITASNLELRPDLAKLVNNGRVVLWEHWSDHTNGNNYLIVDLEEATKVSSFQTYFFWDNYRHYDYSIDVSNDGDSWTEVVPIKTKYDVYTSSGYEDKITPVITRFLKLKIHRNSANPGLHVTEFCAF